MVCGERTYDRGLGDEDDDCDKGGGRVGKENDVVESDKRVDPGGRLAGSHDFLETKDNKEVHHKGQEHRLFRRKRRRRTPFKGLQVLP